MTAPDVLIVIPARLGSSRFKRKVLVPLAGRPLLYHVWREASRSKLADRIVIATDSDEIQQVAVGFGAEVIRTGKSHRTGSDRAAEVMRRIGGKIVVNFQGDTLGLSGRTVDRAIAKVQADRSIGVVTLAHRITNNADLTNPNVVKLICDRERRAIAFSRSLIPHVRGSQRRARVTWEAFNFLHHIGVYVFTADVLRRYSGWPRTPLEKAVSLEQLRLLEHGQAIHVVTTRSKSVSIDSPEDLDNWSRRYI